MKNEEINTIKTVLEYYFYRRLRSEMMRMCQVVLVQSTVQLTHMQCDKWRVGLI